MACPQGNDNMQVTYRKRKHVQKYHLTPQLTVNDTWCGSMVSYYIQKLTTWAPKFTFSNNIYWFKRNLFIEYVETTDANFMFILGSKNEINPTYINRIKRYLTGPVSQVVL
jgi:hypothetical protein